MAETRATAGRPDPPRPSAPPGRREAVEIDPEALEEDLGADVPPEAPDEPPPGRVATAREILLFRVGLGLLVLSYLVYPAFGFIASAAIPASAKAGFALGAWVGSWITFSAGAALAGNEAMIMLRRMIRRKQLRRIFRRKRRRAEAARDRGPRRG